MLRPKPGKELPGGPAFPAACFFTPLANGFMCVGAGGNIEQALISSRILHDGFRLSLHGEHHGPLALFEVFHEVAGTAAKCRERLNVFGDIDIGSHV